MCSVGKKTFASLRLLRNSALCGDSWAAVVTPKPLSWTSVTPIVVNAQEVDCAPCDCSPHEFRLSGQVGEE